MDKAQTEEAPKEEEEETDPNIMGKVADAINSPEDTGEAIGRLTEGTNYVDAMEKLNSELALEEEAISRGLKDERTEARISDLIKLGIQAAGQMYAISKGVTTQIKGLPSDQAIRMREIKEDVDNKRRVLRSRIGAARGLLKDQYSHEKSQDRESEAGEAKALRNKEKEQSRQDTIDYQNERTAQYNEDQKRIYDDSIKEGKRIFGGKWEAATTTRQRKKVLAQLGFAEEEMEDILDKEGTSLSNLFSPDFDRTSIAEKINEVAHQRAKGGRVRPFKAGGSIDYDSPAPVQTPAPQPVQPSGTTQAIQSEQQAAKWRAQYPSLSEQGKRDMEQAFANSPYKLNQ